MASLIGKQRAQGTVSYVEPDSKQAYTNALGDWNKAYGTYSGLMKETSSGTKEITDYYKPGGGYGEGQKTQAKETMQKGVNQDLTQMVSTGMSSSAGAKGVQTLANSELGKMYKNIEDTRNQLWQQSMTPYAQMMTSLSQFMSTRPTYNQYATELQTPGFSKWE